MTATTNTTPAEDLVVALYRLSAVQRGIARHALQELGSQGFTALGVAYKDGPIRVSDVARRLGIDLSVASRQVAALAAAGYVTREPDPEDGRAQRVTATEEGVRVLRESHRRMVAGFADVLAGWDEREISDLARGLDRLRDDFAGRAADRAPSPEEVAP